MPPSPASPLRRVVQGVGSPGVSPAAAAAPEARMRALEALIEAKQRQLDDRTVAEQALLDESGGARARDVVGASPARENK